MTQRKTKFRLSMTPMIDVTFQLLIYFLLATTLIVAEGQIPGNLPRWGSPEHHSVVPVPTTELRVTAAGSDLTGARFRLDGCEATGTRRHAP
ncbi:MAG: ExbD/TolR family protein [Phycisphaerae bacterium]